MWSLLVLSVATAASLSLVAAQSNSIPPIYKNLPRIGRAYLGGGPSGFIWKSTIPSPAFDRRDARGYAGDEYFLKAAKSVPRIGRRNDDGFLKAGKSIPRIGRRNEEFVQEELSQEGKRSLDDWEQMGYYGGGGAGFSNDDHFVYKRKQSGVPAPNNMLF